MPDDKVYGYIDNEECCVGPYPTRDEAVSAGRKHHGYDAFEVWRGVRPDLNEVMRCVYADEVLEALDEHVSNFYEHVNSFPSVSTEAGASLQRKLDALLVQWAKEHGIDKALNIYNVDKTWEIPSLLSDEDE